MLNQVNSLQFLKGEIRAQTASTMGGLREKVRQVADEHPRYNVLGPHIERGQVVVYVFPAGTWKTPIDTIKLPRPRLSHGDGW